MLNEGEILRLFYTARDTQNLCELYEHVLEWSSDEDVVVLHGLFVKVCRDVVTRECNRRRGCVLCGTNLIDPLSMQ